jgi:truncated hemoglobin YjbI
LAVAFYTRVDRDPILRPLFPGKSLTCAIEEFAAFLAQFLGGPSEDSQCRWWLSLRESHLRFKIGARERTAWLANMAAAFPDAPVGIDHPELAHRWEAQLHLDKAVAAIRAGNAPEALKSCGPSVHCGLITLMIRSSPDRFFDHVRASLSTIQRWCGSASRGALC